MKDELALDRVAPTAVATREQPRVSEMLQAVLDKGVSGESVAVVREIAQLLREEKQADAAQAFARAFVALQAEMPAVTATKAVPNRDGSARFKFAPFEELMEAVQPYLVKHGFSVTFNSRFESGRVIQICTLMHVGGHSRANEFSVRIGQGPPGATETQADGAAMTYAKRGAMCNCLNIVIEREAEADPRVEGGYIEKQQAEDLRKRVQSCGKDEVAFLKYAQARTFEEIRTGDYADLDYQLRKAENTTRK